MNEEIFKDFFKISNSKKKLKKHYWQNLKNFNQDYKYINNLHEKILKKLSETLNIVHNEKKKEIYWRILLDPWLYHYLTVNLFIWRLIEINKENIKKIRKTKKELYFKNQIFNYNYYESDDFSSGKFHWYTLKKILNFKYLNLKIKKKLKYFYYKKKIFYKKENFFRKLFFKILKFFLKNNFIYFIDSGFHLSDKIKLSILLKKKIMFFQYFDNLNYLNITIKQKNKRDQLSKIFSFDTKNLFERYILNNLKYDLLSDYIEHYFQHQNIVKKYNFKSKFIITTNLLGKEAHLIKKFFLAEQVNSGSKIIFVPHGGAIPMYKDQYFDFNTMVSRYWISENKIKFRPNQIYLPYLNLKKTKKIKYDLINNSKLTLCMDEDNKFLYHFRSTHHFSDQDFYYQKIKELSLKLNNKIRDRLNFKLYTVEKNWNTKRKFVNYFGKSSISNKNYFEETFHESRLIINTNLETTLYQSLKSGIPTIVFNLPNKYLRDVNFQKLIKKMIKNKILFNNVDQMAKHINNIWDEPLKWWDSKEILKLRKYLDQNLSFKGKKNDLYYWKKFLSSID